MGGEGQGCSPRATVYMTSLDVRNESLLYLSPVKPLVHSLHDPEEAGTHADPGEQALAQAVPSGLTWRGNQETKRNDTANYY